MPALQYCVALLVKNVKKNYTFPSSLLENMAVVAEGSNFSFAWWLLFMFQVKSFSGGGHEIICDNLLFCCCFCHRRYDKTWMMIKKDFSLLVFRLLLFVKKPWTNFVSSNYWKNYLSMKVALCTKLFPDLGVILGKKSWMNCANMLVKDLWSSLRILRGNYFFKHPSCITFLVAKLPNENVIIFNISSVLRNYLDITHSVQFDQKLIIRNMRENGVGNLKGHENFFNGLES